MENKTFNDVLFKVFVGIILIAYGIIFICQLDYFFIPDAFQNAINIILTFIIIVYYISLILFIGYINKNISDKWVLLPFSLFSLYLFVLTVFFVISIMMDFDIFILYLAIIYFVLLIGNLFSTFNIAKNYRFNILNYIILAVMLVLNMILFGGPEVHYSIFSFVGINIVTLYLIMSKKGIQDFIDRNKIYSDLLKTKSLFDQNILTKDEYEKIREKLVKYL